MKERNEGEGKKLCNASFQEDGICYTSKIIKKGQEILASSTIEGIMVTDAEEISKMKLAADNVELEDDKKIAGMSTPVRRNVKRDPTTRPQKVYHGIQDVISTPTPKGQKKAGKQKKAEESD